MGVFDILFLRWCTAYFTKIFQKSEKIVIMVTRVRTERRYGRQNIREVAEWIISGSVNSKSSSNRLGQIGFLRSSFKLVFVFQFELDDKTRCWTD